MSLQAQESNKKAFASTSDEKRSISLAEQSPRQLQTNGKIDRSRDIPMTESRGSGELEGSTLGGSSRDGDRGGQRQRRTQSSSGFLLDSSFLPKTKSLKISQHRPRRSEPPAVEKPPAPEPEIVVPKKRSRFPWSRHKRPADSSPLTPASASATNTQDVAPTEASEAHGLENEPEATANADHAHVGLDKDSIQIVNLALNLSESRKRSTSGRLSVGPIPGGRRTSAGQSSAAFTDVNSPAGVGSLGHHPIQGHRSPSHAYIEDQSRNLEPRALPAARDASPLMGLLPTHAEKDSFPYEFSKSTLARAEKARLHFELFSEYLRLLPSLPPLRHPATDASLDSASPTGDGARATRVYNPLQSIRNRKIRFREKCLIDAEADGWNDSAKVREWVDSVEEQYGQQHRDAVECLKLPSFHESGNQGSQRRESEDPDVLTVSPTASLRRVSRTNSIKPRRPRLDWIISPAELLSDAAWVEEGTNKTKIVDKDGNKLYPDAVELTRSDGKFAPPKHQKGSVSERQETDTHEPHDSAAASRRALSHDLSRVRRGRRKYRLQSPVRMGHGRSASEKIAGSRFRRSRRRSSSASSASTVDVAYSGENPRASRLTQSRTAPASVDSTAGAKTASVPSTGGSLAQPKPNYASAMLDDKRPSVSSATSVEDRFDPRISLEGMDSTAPNSPTQAGYFPSIAVNLSPPSSRSPSPVKRSFPRVIGPLHERSKSKHRSKDLREQAGEEYLESEALRKQETIRSEPVDRVGQLEPSPLPDKLCSNYQEDYLFGDPQHQDNLKPQRNSLQESRLRGIFKGPGRIAEIVGNEVSKVGDRIMKKDTLPQSRRSSSASGLSSSDSESDYGEYSKTNTKSGPKALLRRLPTFSEDSPRPSRRNSEKDTSKSFIPYLPTFTSQVRHDESSREHGGVSRMGSPGAGESGSKGEDADESQGQSQAPSAIRRKKLNEHASDSLGIGPTLHTLRDQTKKSIKDASVPFSLTRPPVTGLARAEASAAQPSMTKRPTLAEASRTWSISDRSITTLADFGLPNKREIERTRALLLSSGIKAREITRRAETVRNPPPRFLQNAVDHHRPIPKVIRLNEFDVAAQNLLQRFDKSVSAFHQSMDRHSHQTSPSLKSQLSSLEALINQSLSPRVRAAASDAENLSVQLNTTSTLAVKQLSDTLDKGIRKRRRRLRWVRRAGFVMLEWALVGVLWWVWLIVMAFKLMRGMFRGAISGIRWILWL